MHPVGSAADRTELQSTGVSDPRPVYVAIALSGATALGAEVLWTRLLSLLLGATTYTFSLIIAAILVGLGIGSSIGAFMGRSTPSPRRALAWCQALLMVAIAWGAYSVIEILPLWPVNPIISSQPSSLFEIDFVRCLWVVLPAAMLWGASFPLALAAVASGNDDPARLVGRVYAANTVGGILGAVLTALLLLPSAGTMWGQRVADRPGRYLGVCAADHGNRAGDRTTQQAQRTDLRACTGRAPLSVQGARAIRTSCWIRPPLGSLAGTDG